MPDSASARMAGAAAAIVAGLASRGSAGSGDARAYLTNPTNGLQTIAGYGLAAIIATYVQIKNAGQNSVAVITATIDALEQVRAGFEAQVRTLGNGFWTLGGRGGVETINRVVANLIADRRAEMTQLGGDAGAIAAAGGNPTVSGPVTSNSFALVAVLILIGVLFLTRR